MNGRAPPHARAGFRTFHAVPLRWADIDRYGHANNVAYLSWFDTAVNAVYAERGILADAPRFIVAETGCTFHREVRFGEAVSVGIRPARIGGSSVTYDLAAFVAEEAEARAQGRYVHVLVGPDGPVPIDAARRAVLEAL